LPPRDEAGKKRILIFSRSKSRRDEGDYSVIERILIYLPIFAMYSLGPDMGLTTKKSDAFRYTRQEAEAIVKALPVGQYRLEIVEYGEIEPAAA
jgi:hypothetical protein